MKEGNIDLLGKISIERDQWIIPARKTKFITTARKSILASRNYIFEICEFCHTFVLRPEICTMIFGSNVLQNSARKTNFI
jgi:hypothetical protein